MATDTDESLKGFLRTTGRRWRVGVLNGLNLSNLHRIAAHRFGPSSGIGSIEDLGARVERLATLLDLDLTWFVSNFEGEILEWVHAAPDRLDGIVINPGGLAVSGTATRQALLDTGLPVIECHLANVVAANRQSVFTAAVTGQIQGFKQHSYTASLVAMAALLDESGA